MREMNCEKLKKVHKNLRFALT